MNPGVQALEKLVEAGMFSKGNLPGDPVIQYFPKLANNVRPSYRDWANTAGLIHTAARWVGTRGLTVVSGRVGAEVHYHYDPREDK